MDKSDLCWHDNQDRCTCVWNENFLGNVLHTPWKMWLETLFEPCWNLAKTQGRHFNNQTWPGRERAGEREGERQVGRYTWLSSWWPLLLCVSTQQSQMWGGRSVKEEKKTAECESWLAAVRKLLPCSRWGWVCRVCCPAISERRQEVIGMCAVHMLMSSSWESFDYEYQLCVPLFSITSASQTSLTAHIAMFLQHISYMLVNQPRL